MIRLRHFAYPLYRFIRGAARLTGLDKPLRNRLGPLAGRVVFSASANTGSPVEVHGHKMVLGSSDSYPPVDMATGNYEEETTRQFEGLIKPGMVIIDVGAHVGYYSLIAAKQVGPKGKVFAFEPEPTNYALLQNNIELNGYQNVMAVNQAVSNRIGSSTLFLTSLDNGRHSIYQHGLPEKGRLEVTTTTIDDFLDTQGSPKVDLIKIDVEGAEVDVIEGMQRLLTRLDHLNLIIEFNPSLLRGAGTDPLQFLEQPVFQSFSVNCVEEKEGLIPLEDVDKLSLVNRLLAKQSSVNLLCKNL